MIELVKVSKIKANPNNPKRLKITKNGIDETEKYR